MALIRIFAPYGHTWDRILFYLKMATKTHTIAEAQPRSDRIHPETLQVRRPRKTQNRWCLRRRTDDILWRRHAAAAAGGWQAPRCHTASCHLPCRSSRSTTHRALRCRHDCPASEGLAGSRRVRERGHALAESSTLNRQEPGAAGTAASDRRRRIVADPGRIDRLLSSSFPEPRTDAPDEVILDMDAADDPIHSEQEGRFFRGCPCCHC